MTDQKVTMFENSILQQLRPKPLLGMVKKLNFLSDHQIVLKFGLSRMTYFSLQNISLWAKIRVKTNEISPKYQKNPYKIFTLFFFFFQEKLAVFTQLRTINCTTWARTGTSRLDDICFGLEDVNFSKKKKKRRRIF